MIEEVAQRDIKGILITHAHYDHIGAVNELRDYYHTDVYATKDTQMMFDCMRIICMLGGEKYIIDGVKVIKDSITLDGMA